jgi:N-methylhydantoinase A
MPEAKVLFEDRTRVSAIYSRDSLKPGKTYSGPAIVTEYSATTVIPPGKRFHLDDEGNLLIAV